MERFGFCCGSDEIGIGGGEEDMVLSEDAEGDSSEDMDDEKVGVSSHST